MITSIMAFLVNMLPGIVPAVILYFCLLPIRKKKLAARTMISSRTREILLLLYIIFCGGLAVLTLTPRWFDLPSMLNGELTPFPPFFQWGNFNLELFSTLLPFPASKVVLLGNIVMFIPLGFAPSLLWEKMSFPKVMLVGFLSVLFIECWQLLIGRTFDVDDFLLNLIGIAVGALICRILQRLIPQLKQTCFVQSL